MAISRLFALFLLLTLTFAASAQSLAPHPRLLLDAPTLTALHKRMAANTPQWQQLKSYCDSFIGGTVYLPDGSGFPAPPDIGAGYSGSGYWSTALAEGLCYQTLVASNPTAAAPYGAKAVQVLMAMSTPYTGAGSHGQDPCIQFGYGTRYYGVAMGIGYDWVYPLLTTPQRTQIYTTANAWLNSFANLNGCSGIVYAHPQGNYFAGYFHADVAIALATYDENPSAPALWTDWQANQFKTGTTNPPHIGVQPYYAQHMTGGGWPEGFGNFPGANSFGPLGTLNMSLPMIEVKTATGVDLIHAAAPYAFPIDAADYLMYFTWPNRRYIDDRDTAYNTGVPSPPTGTADAGMFMQILGFLRYWNAPHAGVFQQYTESVNAQTGGYQATEPWELFLYWDPTGLAQPVTSLPLSYFATGMNAVAALSDWSSRGSWMSFRAGPYVNNPGPYVNPGTGIVSYDAAEEEYFDQGSLALVHGDAPFLINGTGRIVHEPDGGGDGARVDVDNYGNPVTGKTDGSLYVGNRTMYNVFYDRQISGSTVADPYGQGAYTTEANGVQTHVAAFEDGASYVYVLATQLENMYRAKTNGTAQVASWSREIVYLRPNQFVVYDRTTQGSLGDDQFLAFHFPSLPVAGTAATGGTRIDVTFGGTLYAGAMTTVLPVSATTTTIGMYPPNDTDKGSKPVKVWQVQVRPPNTNISQLWLTVFDTSATAASVAAASKITVTSGAATGTLLARSSGNSAVIVNTGAASTTIAGNIAYAVPAVQTTHVITELPANTTYTVSVTVAAGKHAISVVPGGSLTTSAKGVLTFNVAANGAVTP
jgi:hypothetical protein